MNHKLAPFLSDYRAGLSAATTDTKKNLGAELNVFGRHAPPRHQAQPSPMDNFRLLISGQFSFARAP
jgi:hypothetical protein